MKIDRRWARSRPAARLPGPVARRPRQTDRAFPSQTRTSVGPCGELCDAVTSAALPSPDARPAENPRAARASRVAAWMRRTTSGVGSRLAAGWVAVDGGRLRQVRRPGRSVVGWLRVPSCCSASLIDARCIMPVSRRCCPAAASALDSERASELRNLVALLVVDDDGAPRSATGDASASAAGAACAASCRSSSSSASSSNDSAAGGSDASRVRKQCLP